MWPWETSAVYWSPKTIKHRAKLEKRFADLLAPGEQPVAVMRLNSLRPLADTLLITRSRYLTLQSTDTGKPAKATCNTTEVTDLTVSARMRDITLTLRGGTTQRLGSLFDTADEPALTAAVHWLSTNHVPLPETPPAPAPAGKPDRVADAHPATNQDARANATPPNGPMAAQQWEPTNGPMNSASGLTPARLAPSVPEADLLHAAETRTIRYGHKANPDRARKLINHVTQELIDGEHVWLYATCTSFRPSVDALIVTNLRIIGATKAPSITYLLCHEHIDRLTVDAPNRHLTIRTTSGAETTIKNIHGDDAQTIMFCAEHARTNPAVPQLLATAAEQTETYRRTHLRTADEKRADKAEAKAVKEREQRAQAAEDRRNYGTLVYDGSFALRTIRIYNKGYVRVAFPFMRKNATYERLIDITTTSDIGKKTGVGRAAGAVLTSGVNLAFSNKRGDVYITIVTETNTYVLHEEPPNMFNVKQAKKIEGTAKAVLHGAAAQLPTINTTDEFDPTPELAPPEPSAAAPDLAARLTRLNELLANQLITEDEYSQQRQRLLSEI